MIKATALHFVYFSVGTMFWLFHHTQPFRPGHIIFEVTIPALKTSV